jgi:ribosomal protein L16/L10AE
MSKFIIFLKKINKKSEKTKRKLWFRTFPYFPLTRKSQGLRMGKGKGKLFS